MNKFKCTVFLGNISNDNTFKIIYSAAEMLDLPKEIFWPSENNSIDISTTSTLICQNFSEKIFETEPRSIIIFFPTEINLAENIHNLFHLYKKYNIEISNIISIANYAFFDGNHINLLDAMAHFSDVFLIDNSIAIDKNIVNNFISNYKQKECYPLIIKILNNNKFHEIFELLHGQPRRMTLIFDDIDPIDLIDESMVDSAPFSIPTIDQNDKFLKKDDSNCYCTPIELLL